MGRPAMDLAAAHVELQVSDDHLGGAELFGTARERSTRRQDLFEGEGFGHVIVGAGAERFDLVSDGVLGREDENRGGVARSRRVRSTSRPPIPAAASRGRPDRGFPGDEPQRLEAVIDQVGVILGFLQSAPDVLTHDAVVLDDENLHSIPDRDGKEDAEGAPQPWPESTSMRPRCCSTMP